MRSPLLLITPSIAQTSSLYHSGRTSTSGKVVGRHHNHSLNTCLQHELHGKTYVRRHGAHRGWQMRRFFALMCFVCCSLRLAISCGEDAWRNEFFRALAKAEASHTPLDLKQIYSEDWDSIIIARSSDSTVLATSCNYYWKYFGFHPPSLGLQEIAITFVDQKKITRTIRWSTKAYPFYYDLQQCHGNHGKPFSLAVYNRTEAVYRIRENGVLIPNCRVQRTEDEIPQVLNQECPI